MGLHASRVTGTSAKTQDQLDEEAAVESCAVPHPRDILRREYDEVLKERPRDIALETCGREIEKQVLRGLEANR